MNKNRSFFKKLFEHKLATVCFFFIVFLSLLALFAETLSPYPFDKQFPEKALSSMSWSHPLGTDHLGRDLLSRLIYGSRMSMAVGVFTAIISAILGTLYGLFSGWMGGVTDRILMRVIDIMLSIPTLVLLILVKVFADSFFEIGHPEVQALFGAIVALSLISWASLARITRGQVLQVKEELFVEAARALGGGAFRLVFKHILPNILTPLIILLTLQIPSNILFESMLSFLGLGLKAPYSSWGVLINEAWPTLSSYPLLLLAPGFMLFSCIMAFNLLGDSLRDIFDPKMQDHIK